MHVQLPLNELHHPLTCTLPSSSLCRKGEIDQDFWLTSCGGLRQQCYSSYVWRLDDPSLSGSADVVTLRGNLTAEIDLCNCLLSEGVSARANPTPAGGARLGGRSPAHPPLSLLTFPYF